MNPIASIGTIDESIPYIDRPTVKVIIRKDNTILLLNNGLLPGGGIDERESDSEALHRELQEELGATVQDIQTVGTIIQYRNFLAKRYVIKGYTAKLVSIDGITNPQDIGEAQFTKSWVTIDQALELLAASIETQKMKPMDDDLAQGKLYNLMTSYELIVKIR